MRKTIEIILAVLTVLLFITAFASCMKNKTNVGSHVVNNLAKGFSCTADVTFDGNSYQMRIDRKSSGNCAMTFTKPSELSSLSFSLSDGNMKIKYGNMEASVKPSSVPQSAIFSSIVNAVDTAGANKNLKARIDGDNVSITGQIADGPYTLVLSRDGTPKSLSIPNIKLTARFSDFKFT